MKSKLSRGMLYILLANVVTLVVNMVTNFLLPKFLSVDSYAAIKTYQLYMNYVGVFHLGFVDGVYLKYGGEDLHSVNFDDLRRSVSTFRIFQFFITCLMVLISLAVDDCILLGFSFTILSVNVIAYFRMLFQAIGEFGLYSKITFLTTILTFGVNLLILFWGKVDDYRLFLLSYAIVNSVAWILLEVLFEKISKSKVFLFFFSFREFVSNIKQGFFLMCGNLTSFLLTGLDRWFVKFTLENYSFAQYSFAVSIENMLNLAITPITLPLYNYFCKEKERDSVRFIHSVIVISATLLLTSAFVAEIAIEIFLRNYSNSIVVIFLLFGAQAIQFVIKAIYINLYKVEKKQKLYFQKLGIVIVSAVIFNLCFFHLLEQKEAYAIGTLFSAIIWLILSYNDFKHYGFDISDIIYLLIEIFVFMICGLLFDAVMGMFVYLMFSAFLLCILKKQTVIKLIKICSSKIRH